MSQFQCKICGASLEVSAFASTAVCEFCGSTTDLKRDNIKRLEKNSTEISPEEYQKQIERAATSYEKGFYDKAFNIIEELKQFSVGDISFQTLYASYYLAAKFSERIGPKGLIRQSWRNSCDNSGSGCYDDYDCPDFDEVFHDFEHLLEDCEELIANGDNDTSKTYALQTQASLELCRNLWQESIEEFIERYSWTQEEKTRTIKIGDEWINQEYTDYGKNEQAEAVAIEMGKDMMGFYAKIHLHLITSNKLPFDCINYADIFAWYQYFCENKDIPHCTFAKICFEEYLKEEAVENIETFYDFNLLADPTAKHPLGGSVEFKKLCDYSAIIRDFSQKYVEKGLIASSLVESFIQNTEAVRDDALFIRKIYRYGFWIGLPVGLILCTGTPVPMAGLGLILSVISGSIYGSNRTNMIHKQLKELALLSERNIRSEANRRRFADS